MKQFLLCTALLVPALFGHHLSGKAQTSYVAERFLNSYNTNGGALPGSSFTGSMGIWQAAISNNNAILVIDDDPASGLDYALNLGVNATAGGNPCTATSTSPILDLSPGYAPAPVRVSMKLWFQSLTSSPDISFAVEASKDGGSTWYTAYSRTAADLSSQYSGGQWYPLSFFLADSFRTSGFALRLSTSRTAGSTGFSLWIDNIVIQDPTVPDFSGSYMEVVDGGAGYTTGDVYKYSNVVTYPENVDAYVKIEAMSNASIQMFDNNDAGIAQRFQPRIAPAPTMLNGDREGYIQYSITFRKASDNTIIELNGLRFRHFDVDGHTNGTGYFRETGSVRSGDTLYYNNPSTLVNGGSTNSGGYTWKKVLGSTEEHNSVSSDPDVLFTAVYPPTSEIHFRMGYIFKKGNGSNDYIDYREYAAEFGNFSLGSNALISLPIHLLSFSGSRSGTLARLRWETEHFASRFEVERSTDGTQFLKAGEVYVDNTSGGRKTYVFNELLSPAGSPSVYYRLRMFEDNGMGTYSKTVVLHNADPGVAILYPNPVKEGEPLLTFVANSDGTASFRIADVDGRTLQQWTAAVHKGSNSMLVAAAQLPAGQYLLEARGAFSACIRFCIAR